MNVYLKIRLSALIVTALFITARTEIHADNCKFYKTVLSDWGYNIEKIADQSCINTDDFKIVTTKNNLTFRIYSNFEVFRSLDYPKVFLSTDIPNAKEQAYIYVKNSQNTTEFIFPENYLIDYKFSNILKNYISSYYESNKKAQESDKIESTPNLITQNRFLAEISGYAIVIFMFVAIFYRIIKLLIDHPSKLEELKLLIKSKIVSVYLTFDKLKPFIMMLAFLAFLSLIRIASLIAYEDQNTVSLGYVISLISKLESNSFILSSIENRSETNLVLAINFQILIHLIALIAIPYVFRFLIVTSNVIKNCRIKVSSAKYFYITLGIIGILLTSININSSYTSLIAIIVVSIILAVSNWNKPQFFELSKNQKLLLIAISIILFGIVLSYKYFENKRIPTIEYKLFDFNAKVVIPPAIYELDDSAQYVFVQKHEVNSNTPVFMNNYLIYHPKYKKIINTNIENIDINSDNFYLTYEKKTGNIIGKIISDKRYKKFYESTTPSKTLIFDSSEKKTDSVIVNIVEKCTKPLDPYIIELNQIDLRGTSIEYSFTDKIINSKGCSSIDSNLNVYKYELILATNEKRIFTIPTESELYIELENGDEKGVLEGYISDEIYKPTILIENQSNSDVIYNIIPTKEIEDIVIEEDNQPQSIGATIQDLYDQGLVSSKLEFWTPNMSPIIDRLK